MRKPLINFHQLTEDHWLMFGEAVKHYLPEGYAAMPAQVEIYKSKNGVQIAKVHFADRSSRDFITVHLVQTSYEAGVSKNGRNFILSHKGIRAAWTNFVTNLMCKNQENSTLYI